MFRVWGGESQGRLNQTVFGYSVKAQCTGKKTAYLEPNSNSLQKPKRGRLVLAVSAKITMLKISAFYRGRGVKKKASKRQNILPLTRLFILALNKGAIEKKQQKSLLTKSQYTAI